MLFHTLERLRAQNTPWVVENVSGAKIRADICLCGCMFGLKLRRKRIFETSWHHFELTPSCNHADGVVVSVVGHGTPTWVRDKFVKKYGRQPNINDYRLAMGIDWMNRGELSQAIPPAYTEWIGTRLMQVVKR